MAMGPDSAAIVMVRSCTAHCAECIKQRLEGDPRNDNKLFALQRSVALAGYPSFRVGSFDDPMQSEGVIDRISADAAQ